MKKCSLILGILVLIFGLVFFMGTRDVMAADDEFEAIIEDTKTTNSTPTSNTSNVSNTSNTNASKNNTNTNKNNTNTNNSNLTANNVSNSNNVSNYNNTNNNTPNSLSKAGLEDSIPTMVLIVIFAISAIYAFKKINDYKNV